jgi:hypothetical protein
MELQDHLPELAQHVQERKSNSAGAFRAVRGKGVCMPGRQNIFDAW